jgi:hypothetical protein
VEYVFKIVLGTYNRRRKKPIGIMTDGSVALFNQMVERIDKHLEDLLNINRDYRFQKIDLLNFADYFDMQFDKDADGEIYPDTSVKFEKEPETEMLKGKKKGVKKKKGDNENTQTPGIPQ